MPGVEQVRIGREELPSYRTGEAGPAEHSARSARHGRLTDADLDSAVQRKQRTARVSHSVSRKWTALDTAHARPGR